MYAVRVANSAAQVSTRLYTGPDAERVAARAHLVPRCAFEQVREPPVGEALALELAQLVAPRASASARLLERELEVDDLLDLREEPRVDLRVARAPPRASCRCRTRRPRTRAARRAGRRARRSIFSGSTRLQVEAVDAHLQPAQRLLQRLLERAPDGHHLAHRLHLRGEAVVGLRELLEGEARHLRDHVVDRRLEGRRRRAAGDVVARARRACSRPRAWRRSWRSGSRWPWRRAPRSATRAGSSR